MPPLTRTWFGKSKSTKLADELQLRVMSFNILAQQFSKGAPEGNFFPPPDANTLDGKACPEGLLAVQGSSVGSGHSGGYKKTKLCTNFQQGCCPRGDTCNFAHGDDELGTPQAGPSIGGASRELKDFDEESRTFRCPQSVLQWRRRWPQIRALVLDQNADLVALQEVDLGDEEIWLEIRNAFKAAGYSGRKAKKLQNADDGVVLFWRTSRLRAVGDAEVWRISPKSCHVALVQKLLLDGRLSLRAVTTHLKAGITLAAESDRYAQIKAITRQLTQTAEPRVPTLLLADLNSHCRKLTGDGGVPVDPLVYDYLLNHGFRSLSKEVSPDGGEMPFTCWGGWQNHDVAGVFDYILSYEENVSAEDLCIQPRRLLCMNPSQVRQFSERLPNKEHPSDHIPVVLDLVLKATQTTGARACGPAAAVVSDPEEFKEPAPILIEPEEPQVKESVDVPRKVIGKVIGVKGQVIKDIRGRSGVSKAEVWQPDDVDPCKVHLEGTADEVERAKKMILEQVASATAAGGDTKRRGSWKSALCKKFDQGHCERGDECSYAHGPAELCCDGGTKRQGGWKSALCRHFEQGRCEKGDDCSYAHGQHDLAVPGASPTATAAANNGQVADCPGYARPNSWKMALCQYYINGACGKQSAECSFAHGPHDLAGSSTYGRAQNPQIVPPVPAATERHCSLYVSNLPGNMQQEAFRKVFEGHGTIVSLKLKNAERYGFVQYSSSHEAESAIRALHDLQYSEEPPQKLSVKFAHSVTH